MGVYCRGRLIEGGRFLLLSLYHYLNRHKKNFVKYRNIRKRKREVGLVVSAKYDCYTYYKKTAQVLDEKIYKKKKKFMMLELKYQKKVQCKTFRSFFVLFFL